MIFDSYVIYPALYMMTLKYLNNCEEQGSNDEDLIIILDCKILLALIFTSLVQSYWSILMKEKIK